MNFECCFSCSLLGVSRLHSFRYSESPMTSCARRLIPRETVVLQHSRARLLSHQFAFPPVMLGSDLSLGPLPTDSSVPSLFPAPMIFAPSSRLISQALSFFSSQRTSQQRAAHSTTCVTPLAQQIPPLSREQLPTRQEQMLATITVSARFLLAGRFGFTILQPAPAASPL